MGQRNDTSADFPWRLEPYVLLNELAEEVVLAKGPFRLVGPKTVVLHADLSFRWQPTQAVAFEGESEPPLLEIGDSYWVLESESKETLSASALLTGVTVGNERSEVRGLVNEPIDIGTGSFSKLRFSLANFPDYFGEPIRYQQNHETGVYAGRMTVKADQGECRIDKIREAVPLAQRADKESGYFVSHVGEWIPTGGNISINQAESVIQMLRVWFGFLRGAWSGPVFPQGLWDNAVVWRQLAAWKLGESRKVPSWLPLRRRNNLSDAFSGFVHRWQDPAWHRPICGAISWYIEANSSDTALETRIAITQIALELLSWVHIVETQSLHSRSDFEKLSASGKIRTLLQNVGVSLTIPGHLERLTVLQDNDAFDGPGILTKVRNALIHATDRKREFVGSLDGHTLSQCADLGLGYIELCVLAICRYEGDYARRGWRGWKGDDEVPVPWAERD